MAHSNDQERGVQRLLAGESRGQLLDLLRETEEPLTVSDLAKSSGLHENTVRGHLDQLVEAGFVTRRKEQRKLPGRPRIGYRATVSGSFSPKSLDDDADSLRLLCRVLAAQAATPVTSGTLWQRSRSAAEKWITEYGDIDASQTIETAEEALAVIAGIMHERGFAPNLIPEQRMVVLHSCPYADLAAEQQQVVCGIHLGMLLGTLERMNSPVGARFSNIDPITPRCTIELTELPKTTKESS